MKKKGEGKVYIGFGFVKVMQINKRKGVFVKMERVRCFSWPMVACHGEG